ncbi:MAG: UDP-N-acetylmuramoyl-tripeptide--D-alanyl-D-alanine ligase [Thermodesulfobacteriota bacterium]|nr:UDP-N-acetylmuramoyl-tripeptide--D-alanyl-D-alanine ligase [Thermodesulfobacteriota bacterium]
MSEADYKFSVNEILAFSGGSLIHGSHHVSFKDISTDSRTIRAGELFIALEGEHFDGHRFITEVREKGASGAIVKKGALKQEEQNSIGFVIEVEDTLKALGDIARFWRMKHPIQVVGITGSNGKTTTKDMVGKILEIPFNILKTEGNFNNQVGLPLTLLRLKEKDEIAVLELGTNSRSEIKRLSHISLPDVAVITNIGLAHLQGFRSVDELTDEKGEIFKALSKDGFAVINEDDARVSSLGAACKCKKIRFALQGNADIMAKDVSTDNSGNISFILISKQGDVHINLPLYGTFNVYNALAAAGVAQALGIGLDVIQRGLEDFYPPSGRMEVMDFGWYMLINDAYNANPNSVEMALKTLVTFKGAKRTIAVLGDMLELGEFSESEHIHAGKLVSKLGIDYLFTMGEESVNIAQGAREDGMNIERIYSGKEHKEVFLKLKATIKDGDCILVKGSRAMKMELIIKELIE